MSNSAGPSVQPASTPQSTHGGVSLPKHSWMKEHKVLVACLLPIVVQFVLLAGVYFLEVDGRMAEVENRLAHVEDRMDTLEDSLSRIEGSVNALDDKVDRILIGLARSGVKALAGAAQEEQDESADQPFPRSSFVSRTDESLRGN